LHLVDVSDPAAPKLLRTIGVNTGLVVVADGVAYAAVAGQLQSYDLLTGELLQTLSLGGQNLTGLAREGSVLCTMDAGNTLRVVDVSTPFMVARGSLGLPAGGG